LSEDAFGGAPKAAREGACAPQSPVSDVLARIGGCIFWPAISSFRVCAMLHITSPCGEAAIHPDRRTDPPLLADLLARKGLALNTRCNRRGLCAGCTVSLESGGLRDSAGGGELEAPRELLACRAEWIPGAEAAIRIPARSLLAHRPSVADDFVAKVATGGAPLFPGEFGLAIDIGTTTVVVLLAEMATGRILSRASGFNQQIRFGDDVLTRIQLCHSQPEMVAKLQEAICRDTLLPLAGEACEKAGIAVERVGGMCVAANTTMLHLLFGIDPSPMGIAPFTATFLEYRVTRLHALGLCELPDMPVHALPGLAAYVGADIAAGIFATGLHYETEPVLLVDAGTNGEIVLAKGDRLYACATAAGPAFEGCGLSCGMRATDGAIEAVSICREGEGTPVIACKTIGDKPLARTPGICGSAYIDFLAQGRSAGLLMENGRFDPDAMTAAPALFCNVEYGRALLLSANEAGPRITEPDVALLLQAKAAIAAGIETLLHLEGLRPADLKKVYLAGGFGMHIDVTHATACGLLPGIDPDQIEAVGNTSLGGAYLAMLDRSAVDEMDNARRRVEVVELNLDAGFEDRYIENLRVP